MRLKDNIFYKFLKSVYLTYIHFVCDFKRKRLTDPLRNRLLDLFREDCNDAIIHELSIISSNCFAGRIMQDLGIKYNSPTLGLYFMYPDFIEFLTNLKYYLTEAKIEFVEHSKYSIGDVRRNAWSHWYPIGLLGGNVEIHFLHYYSEQDAAEKWYRRARRVNFNNLIVIGMDQNLCSEKDIIDFDSLPFKNKIFFSRFNLPLTSNEYMPEFSKADSVGDPYRKGNIFYRHFIDHFSK